MRPRIFIHLHSAGRFQVEHGNRLAKITLMKFVGASLTWLLMAFVLGFGLWKVTNGNGGSIWWLLIPVFAFVVAVGAIGCKTH